MEASFKSKGSFGIPEQMQRDLEASRKKPAGPPEAPVGDAVPVNDPRWVPPGSEELKVAEPVKTSEELTAAERERIFIQERAKLEESLETKITEEDIKDYIFRGRLAKEIAVIPGIMKSVFQTLNGDEAQDIDNRVALIIDGDKKLTGPGLDNERSILNLSYSWVSAAGKPLAVNNDPKKREVYIRKMGTHLLDAAAAKLGEFNLLVKLTLREKSFIKKS